MNTSTSPMLCVICSQAHPIRHLINMSFGVYIVQCANCGFVQTEPVSKATLNLYYEKYYRERWTLEELEARRSYSREQAESQVSYLKEILGPLKFLAALDYGTGDGELPRILQMHCSELFATEEDPLYLKYLSEESWLTILPNTMLQDKSYANKFDLITASHVLEHLPDPGATLGMFAVLLMPGGILLIDVPNEVKMLNHGAQADGHLQFFSQTHLQQLIERDGLFDILEIRQCNRSVDDFIASKFSLPEDYSISKNDDGTTIRALLRNRDHGLTVAPKNTVTQPLSSLFESYSEQILELHHKLKKSGS